MLIKLAYYLCHWGFATDCHGNGLLQIVMEIGLLQIVMGMVCYRLSWRLVCYRLSWEWFATDCHGNDLLQIVMGMVCYRLSWRLVCYRLSWEWFATDCHGNGLLQIVMGMVCYRLSWEWFATDCDGNGLVQIVMGMVWYRLSWEWFAGPMTQSLGSSYHIFLVLKTCAWPGLHMNHKIPIILYFPPSLLSSVSLTLTHNHALIRPIFLISIIPMFPNLYVKTFVTKRDRGWDKGKNCCFFLLYLCNFTTLDYL